MMEAIYKLKANEINAGFIDAVRKMFMDKLITISITDEPDETVFLSRDPANEKYLSESMAQEPAIRFSPEEFREEVKKM